MGERHTEAGTDHRTGAPEHQRLADDEQEQAPLARTESAQHAERPATAHDRERHRVEDQERTDHQRQQAERLQVESERAGQRAQRRPTSLDSAQLDLR